MLTIPEAIEELRKAKTLYRLAWICGHCPDSEGERESFGAGNEVNRFWNEYVRAQHRISPVEWSGRGMAE